MRDNFSRKTVGLLGKRAAYRCSNPECRILTVGAHEFPNKATIIGFASHITAAAPSGPRYDYSLSQEQRKSIDNGIWLCGNCSSLIDKDEFKYNVKLLNTWKAQIENETAEELRTGANYKKSKQFDFEVSFNEGELIKSFTPKFYRKLKVWQLKKNDEIDIYHHSQRFIKSRLFDNHNWYARIYENTNTAICNLVFKIKNTGSVVIENWYVKFKISGEHKLINEMRFQPLGVPYAGFNTMERKVVDESKFRFSPSLDFPLIQDDEQLYEIEIIPLPHEYEIKIEWELKARDFQKSGELKLQVNPKYEDEFEYIYTTEESEIKDTEVLSIRENKFEIDRAQNEEEL
jgi:hypothetical protein